MQLSDTTRSIRPTHLQASLRPVGPKRATRDDSDIVNANHHARASESINAHGDSALTRGTGFEEERRKNNGKPSSLLDGHRGVASRELMETNEAFREPVRRQQQLVNWLRLATVRLGEAQNKRIWAVVKAYP